MVKVQRELEVRLPDPNPANIPSIPPIKLPVTKVPLLPIPGDKRPEILEVRNPFPDISNPATDQGRPSTLRIRSLISNSGLDATLLRRIPESSLIVRRSAMTPRKISITGGMKIPSLGSTLHIYRRDFPDEARFRFRTFYHPYIDDFMDKLSKTGLDGLLDRDNQNREEIDLFAEKNLYGPDDAYIATDGGHPLEDVDFSTSGPMSVYNWELFFYAPLLIAERLSQNQQFEEAQKWFHYIFNPLDASSFEAPGRFWRTRPFFKMQSEAYRNASIDMLLCILASRGNAYDQLDSDKKKIHDDLVINVDRWRRNPFNPFLIARTRPTAFQRAVVMKYLDNLIAWGNQLFSQDMVESITEATQIYMLAAEILGERPAEIPARAVPTVQTYNSIRASLDAFSNALVTIEEFIPVSPAVAPSIVSTANNPQSTMTPTMLYFSVPRNEKLLSYWDTVSDALFKIRHGMNIQGVTRQLALYQPPINPMLLVQAAASAAASGGTMDLGSILGDLNAPLPYYRYSTMVARAMDLCNDLKAFGAALLAALEKRDAGALELLRAVHEREVLDTVRAVKQGAIDEAVASLTALQQGRQVIETRLQHYRGLKFMNASEQSHQGLEIQALNLQNTEMMLFPYAALIALVPQFKIGAPTSKFFPRLRTANVS